MRVAKYATAEHSEKLKEACERLLNGNLWEVTFMIDVGCRSDLPQGKLLHMRSRVSG